MSSMMKAAFLGLDAHFVEAEPGQYVSRDVAARGYLSYPFPPENLAKPSPVGRLILAAHRRITQGGSHGQNV